MALSVTSTTVQRAARDLRPGPFVIHSAASSQACSKASGVIQGLRLTGNTSLLSALRIVKDGPLLTRSMTAVQLQFLPNFAKLPMLVP